jgi:hypothetical protein
MFPALLDALPNDDYNTWQGFGCPSIAGDVEPFLDLMKHLVPDDEYRHYVLQIIGYPIANPGAKLNVALVLKGTTGAGKSLLSEILTNLYGEANCSKIGNRELGSTFNGFMGGKQFISAEEAKGDGNIRPNGESVKDWITGGTILVNEKYEKARPVRNVANFMFLSNDRLPLFMAGNDRRYVVIDIQNKFGDERGIALKAWSKGGGVCSVRYYLEHDVDFTGFSPTADARTSPAKVDVINAGRSAIERFAHEIMKDADRPAFATGKELYQLADVELHIGDGKHTQLGNALKDAGAICVRERFRINPKLRDIKDRIWQLRGDSKEIDDEALRIALESEQARREVFSGKASLDELHDFAARKQERLAAEEVLTKRASDAEREASYYKERYHELSEKERNREFRDRMREIDKANKKSVKEQLRKDAEATKSEEPNDYGEQ